MQPPAGCKRRRIGIDAHIDTIQRALAGQDLGVRSNRGPADLPRLRDGARLEGKTTIPFVYKAPGQLAAIGRRTGVARIFGLKFSGFVGWVLWRTVYLSKLPRIEKRLRVALQWTLDAVFERDLVQCITSQDIASLNRLLEGARHDFGSSSPGASPAASPPIGSERKAS